MHSQKNREGNIIYYREEIEGTNISSNYIWFILLLIIGIGFFIAGISSYLNDMDLKNNGLNSFSNIKYLPQGILLVFYGTCSIFLSLLIFLLIKINLGAGKNIYDIENEVVHLSRKGFLYFNNNLKLKQKIFYFSYPFSIISNLELEIKDGINPNRTIYLILKDTRRIPLNPKTKLENIYNIELKAIELAKILNIDLKFNDKTY